jgi:hypothetical protein
MRPFFLTCPDPGGDRQGVHITVTFGISAARLRLLKGGPIIAAPMMMPGNKSRPEMFKVGDRVRFDPEIPRPPGWAEMTWHIVQLSPHWMPGRHDLMLAELRAADGTVMDAVDTRLLVPAVNAAEGLATNRGRLVESLAGIR